MSTVTAIIPSYNAALYLGEALRSVFAQTRRPDEVIVVDDCSTDGTTDVARQFPVTLLSTTTNSGHAAARNIGIHAARGDLIAWLDADDYWDPNHCEVVCGLLDRFPSAAVACSGVRLFGTQSGEWISLVASDEPVDAFWQCVKHTVVPAMSAVARRGALLECGGFDAGIRVAPDFDLWMRMARRHLFVATRQITSNYRWHPGQISSHSDRQVASIYQSRYKYWASSLTDDRDGFSSRFAAVAQEVWAYHLEEAWENRRLDQFKFFLSLSRFVPGGDGPEYQKWRSRGRVPRLVIQVYDWLRFRRVRRLA